MISFYFAFEFFFSFHFIHWCCHVFGYRNSTAFRFALIYSPNRPQHTRQRSPAIIRLPNYATLWLTLTGCLTHRDGSQMQSKRDPNKSVMLSEASDLLDTNRSTQSSVQLRSITLHAIVIMDTKPQDNRKSKLIVLRLNASVDRETERHFSKYEMWWLYGNGKTNIIIIIEIDYRDSLTHTHTMQHNTT